MAVDPRSACGVGGLGAARRPRDAGSGFRRPWRRRNVRGAPTAQHSGQHQVHESEDHSKRSCCAGSRRRLRGPSAAGDRAGQRPCRGYRHPGPWTSARTNSVAVRSCCGKRGSPRSGSSVGSVATRPRARARLTGGQTARLRLDRSPPTCPQWAPAPAGTLATIGSNPITPQIVASGNNVFVVWERPSTDSPTSSTPGALAPRHRGPGLRDPLRPRAVDHSVTVAADACIADTLTAVRTSVGRPKVGNV